MNNKPPGFRPRTTINTRTDMWGIIKPSTVQQCPPPDTRPTTNHAGTPDTEEYAAGRSRADRSTAAGGSHTRSD